MADQEQLRRAMLKQLGDIDLRGAWHEVSEGHTAYQMRTKDDAREAAVKALMPLIEYWMSSIILLSNEDFERVERELDIRDDDDDSTAFSKMFALNKIKTVFEEEDVN